MLRQLRLGWIMNLSPHFTLAELTVSEWAKARGISNEPTTDAHWRNLGRLALELERARAILGANPILISSAYRNPVVNKGVGGVSNSAHAQGLAADFTCPRFGNVTQVCRAIADSDLMFDQLIWEYGRWVHLGFRLGTQRRQLLTKRDGQGYASGLPS